MANALNDLRDCIGKLNLSTRPLADVVQLPDRDLRRMIAGHQEMPPELAAWTSKLAAFLRDNPPPRFVGWVA